MLLYTVRLTFLYKVIYLFAALLDPKFQVCVYQNSMSTYYFCRFLMEKLSRTELQKCSVLIAGDSCFP